MLRHSGPKTRARRRQDATRMGRSLAHLALISAIIAMGIPGRGWAQATDTALGPATVTHGEGQFTINQQSHTEFTQGSQQAIVSWQNDIQQPAGHTLEFRQEADFSILNQNPGERASEFYGRVVCDATCIFANEAGIHFGDGSYIDVGRMFAVAGRVAEGDFLAGVNHFTDLAGDVTNRGTLQGQHIALLGQRVANYGHVETPQGSFMMLAGDEIWLRDHDSPVLIRTELAEAGVSETEASVENTGQIHAEGGVVRLAAGDMLSFAIRQDASGEIRADEISLDGGEGLVEVRGQLDARGLGEGQEGGAIDVVGDYVILGEGAVLDASGAAGGGKVRVGGALQGGDELATAKGTYVHSEARILADALDHGDGGEIIVWADETAQVYGSLYARGGTAGGQGGFVETSGKGWLDVTRAPHVTARSGNAWDQGGQWLIDPNNIRIVDRNEVPCNDDQSCLDPGLSEDQLFNPIFYEIDLWPVIAGYYGSAPDGPVLFPSVDNSTLGADLIIQAWTQGVNVWVSTNTASDVQGDQDGDIIVDADLRVLDSAVDFGTQARLVLWAANDIVVNNFIGVDRGANPNTEAPTNLTLDIDLWANSRFTIEKVTNADQTPPQYLGSLDINADIDTGGGTLILNGADINLAADAQLRTDGGLTSLFATEGDIQILGQIDTSSQVVTEQEGSRPGGDILIGSQVIRRPQNALDDLPSLVVGGNVSLADSAQFNTGGGLVQISVSGGAIDIDGNLETEGGQIDLFATTAALLPLTSQDEETITTGGRITIGNPADITTAGGSLTAGYIEGQSAQATQVFVSGRIDTRAPDDDDGNPQVGGAIRLGALSANEEEQPGQIVIQKFEGDTEEIRLTTGGADFIAVSDGDFILEDAVLDARADSTLDSTTINSQIQIRTDGNARITETTTGTTQLMATQLIEMGYASSEANGDILFEGNVEVNSPEVILQAGYRSGSNDSLASIELGEARFTGIDDASPLTFFSLTQQADLNTDVITQDTLEIDDLEGLTLSSRGGVLTVSAPENISAEGLDLNLVGATGIDITTAFPGEGGGKLLSTLSIDALGDLSVDALTAGRITGAAQNLVITAGASEEASEPSLTIEGDLQASDSITLHAGAEGSGDLVIVAEDPLSPIVLDSSAITLWAGDGEENGEAKVQIANVTLQDSSAQASRVSAFTLRQDAPISDETIGADALGVNFAGGIGGVEYTLRADAESPSGPAILIGEAGANFLEDSRLHLYARGDIALEPGADNDLTVQSLDIGGINDFTYTSALNDEIAFTDDAQSQLTLRAGLSGSTGVLSFDGGMTIESDEIRLVAGDGAPTFPSETPPRINMTPISGDAPIFKSKTDAGLTFLFRQDADITQADLPDFDTQFGEGLPKQIAFRSDNGTIAFNEFSESPLIQAESTIILSAASVSLSRTDGQDLNIPESLSVTSADPDIQIRSDLTTWNATGSALATESPAVVKPGSDLRLTGFDALSNESEGDTVPPAFDFDEAPNTAPGLLSVIQDGDITPADLINPSTQLGNDSQDPVTWEGYSLSSLQGGIEITPDKVTGADLSLTLSESENAGAAARTIVFNGETFSVASLSALSPYGMTIGAADTALPLTLKADEVLRIQAGLSGVGDMTFAGDVTLEGSIIFLAAGDNPAERTDPDAAPSTSQVMAYDEDSEDFSLDLVLRQTETNDTFLSILQAGSLTNTPDSSTGGNRIPDQSQITAYDRDGLEANLDALSFNSTDGDIEITNLFGPTGESTLPTDELVLTAGYLASPTSQTVILDQTDGQDFDPTVFDAFVVLASDIQFSTTGNGYVKLDDSLDDESRILLLGAIDLDQTVGSTSPLNLSITQNQSFNQSANCDTGCLPNPNTQFGPGGTAGMGYSLTSNSEILINDTLAEKTFGTNLFLTGSEITFEIDSPRDLDVFVASLDVNAGGGAGNILFRGLDEDPLTIFSIGDQTYQGHTLLEGTTEFYASTVEFDGTIEADDSPEADLEDEIIVLTENQAIFRDHIGQSETSEIELFRILFDPGALDAVPNALFGGEVEGETRVRADRIDFFNSSNPEATGSDPIRIPTVATISKFNGDLTLEAETFNMGMGEKLSVQGNLDIQASTSATLGDLSALEIAVTSPLITLLLRPAGEVLTPFNGLLPDAGVDYVANEIVFQQNLAGDSPNLVLSGDGLRPIFGLDDPSEIPEWMKNFSTFQIQPSAQPITASFFVLPGYNTLADLHPQGASRDDPSTLYFNQAIPPRPTAWNPSNWIPFNRASVEELDIDAEPMTARAYESLLIGATLIDNVGTDFTPWNGRPLPVSEARLDGEEAAQAVALMNQLFGPRGKRAERVKAILQTALNQYRRNTGAQRIVGFELRRYVKNRPSSLYEAHQMLEDLDLLFAMHRSLGLTPGEYRPIQKRWLDVIKPEGITTGELAEAIHPSQYVRGTDVLDIFGD